ncbi:MAG: hypothetical protein EP298_11895 [Gammaproteobacteria bacterium]|nr:MAG: hypothetical protein EP298_11895 [Gammaproteobacteria bacterium]
MADLKDILKKNSEKASNSPTKKREKISIAKDLRPYHIDSKKEEKSRKKHDNNVTKNGKQTVSNKIANGKQTVSNKIANGKQTVSNEIANGKQTVSNEIANGKQTVSNEIANGKQTVSNEIAQTVSNEIANGKQTVSKTVSNDEIEPVNYEKIKNYTGWQEELIIYLYKCCISEGGRITNKLTLNDIKIALDMTNYAVDILNKSVTIGMLKSTISRVKEKGAISIFLRKNGRSGWCQYEMNKNLFLDISKNRNIVISTNHDQLTDSKTVSKETHLYNKENNKDSFIKDEERNLTKGWWSDIDLSPLEEFGMTKLKFESAVKNRETTFEPEAIQESIYHYAYTIEHFPEKVERYKNSNGGILSGLLGMLRKGSVWVEDNYRSAEEEALEKKLKVEREKLKRIKEQKEEMFKLQFEVWHESLNDEELKKVQKEVKGKTSGKTSGAMYDAALKAYYKQHIHTPK